MLTGAAVNARHPGYNLAPQARAVFQPQGGYVMSERAIVAHVRAAQAAGAEIHAREQVLGWDARPGGEGVVVTTDRGRYEAARLVLTAGAFPALAATGDAGDVEVVNTETVQAYTDATGKVQTKRIYEQLALTGNGTVDLANPITTSGLRNLDGFGGFDVEGDEQVVNMEVDGEERLRSVSNYEGDLPLEVEVTYSLDGEVVDPSDVVGESGDLEVLYTDQSIAVSARG